MRKKGGIQGKSRNEMAQNESEKWRSMPEAEKAIWRLRYAEKKKQNASPSSSQDIEDKRRSLALQLRGNDCPKKLTRRKGKKTPNAYLLFANEMRKKSGIQGKSRSEMAQNESEMWRSMPEAEKAIWRLRYAEKKKQNASPSLSQNIAIDYKKVW